MRVTLRNELSRLRQMPTLRERNRIAIMGETQQLALELFQERGFDEVTVAEIAASLGIAASTIYRHFGTKENLVLWDEHEPAIVEELAARLDGAPPLMAIRDTLIATLAPLYDDKAEFELGRIGYIFATPQLHGAAVSDIYRTRAELTDILRQSPSAEVAEAAPILAGGALMAMNAAVEAWFMDQGRVSLAERITEAFATLAALDTIS